MKKVIRVLILFIFITIFVSVLAGCKAFQISPQGVDTPVDKNKQLKKTVKATYDLAKIDSRLIEGNVLFAFNIFKQLNEEDSDKNIFISPLSISTALSMTYNGAKSTTKEAMEKVLQYRDIDSEDLNKGYKNLLIYLNNADPKVELNINNSIWFKKGEVIEQDFLEANRDNFDAYIADIDFQDEKAADTINEWIDKATKGKIDKMIDPPILPDVVMYLINAIYFKGQWTTQFNKDFTFTGVFNTEEGQEKEIQMMNRKGKVEYGEIKGTKIVRLPYGDKEVAMYCILPEKGTKINDYVNKFSIEEWIELKDNLLEQDDVRLQIPRFKMEYGVKKLNDSLIKLGMGEAFGNSADFSGIKDDIFISRVLHKAVIDVNEEGSEAAAVTVVEMNEGCVIDPIEFIADRPFLFIIADNKTKSILFMGKFME
jgi:serine protease inhibitor